MFYGQKRRSHMGVFFLFSMKGGEVSHGHITSGKIGQSFPYLFYFREAGY